MSRASLGTFAALLLLAPSLRAQSSFSASLAVDPPFPLLGGSVAFELEAPAGARWQLFCSTAAFELELPPLGTLFLDPAALFALSESTVPATGRDRVVVSIPADPLFDRAVLHFQAAVISTGVARLSASVSIRIAIAMPSGARSPLSIAIAPDGPRAFVANRDDGTVSVLDVASDRVIAELPAGPSARFLPHGAVHVAVDPEGRHVFAINAAAEAITVIDAATGSIAGAMSVPRGCRRIAFDFGPRGRRLYVTNGALGAILVFEENPTGRFAQLGSLLVTCRDPGPVEVLGDGTLVVGGLGSRELEKLDGWDAGGASRARLALPGLPYDLVSNGGQLLVPTFSFGAVRNDLLAIDVATFRVTAQRLRNDGTDYLDVAIAGSLVAVAAAGSGTIVFADAATQSLLSRVELAPGEPLSYPRQAAFVVAAGQAIKLYAVDPFRDSVRAIDIGAGPSFQLGAEIALGHAGAPRVPLRDLSAEEDGEWFLRSAALFGTPALSPNPITCITCHPDLGSDGRLSARHAPTFFLTGRTSPYRWDGTVSDLRGLVSSTRNFHSSMPSSAPAGSIDRILAFLTNASQPPPSPFLQPDGALSPQALAGKALFDGAAGCSTCHEAPLFIPNAPASRTITAGVGTGLAPVNVPTLLGLWSSAPYLHDGTATSLRDVLTRNTNGLHGTTSALSSAQLDDLVAYLRSL